MHSSYIRLVPGSRCAVLLVHGIVSTPRMFDEFLPLIPPDWSVYNLLLDGHGGEVLDFARASMDRWKAQVRQVLEKLCKEYDRVAVIAHSMGTQLTLLAAPGKPQLSGMVLLDVPMKVWVSPSMCWRSLKFALLGSKGRTLTEQATYRCIGTRLTPKVWEYLLWLPRFFELLALCRQLCRALPQPDCRCRVFHARHDELVRVSSANYFRELPWAEHTVLENSGHFYMPEQDKQLVIDAISSLFAEK